MTDLTPTLHELLKSKPNAPRLSKGYLSTETADEFLKEAYRINNHIASLLHYLHRIRPSYLSINHHHHHNNNKSSHKPPSDPSPLALPPPPPKDLTDTSRAEIDTSTSHLLRQLSTSISTLASAETLRQETRAQLLRKKYGSRVGGVLARWAAGGDDGSQTRATTTTPEQRAEEAAEDNTKQLRAAVLWFLQRKLEGVVAVQRGMVEKRLERVRERERSVLYLSQQQQQSKQQQQQQQQQSGKERGEERGLGHGFGQGQGQGSEHAGDMMLPPPPGETQGQRLEETELHAIEAQLSPEQLQLFAEENGAMVKYYEDTLSKVRTAEKSLLEISSLQQTLVAHLSTQEEYINQLVTDASNTHSNIGQGNKELKRASERRSTAQAVFWGTVGLCTWLVVWDLVF